MNKKIRIISLFFIFCLSFFIFSPVFAQQSIFTEGLDSSPGAVTTVTNLVKLIGNLACYAIRFGIISSVIALVIYGIMFFKSRGNPQEFGGARRAFTWALVGVAVIFGVFTIIMSVSSLVGYGSPNYINYPIFDIIKCS